MHHTALIWCVFDLGLLSNKPCIRLPLYDMSQSKCLVKRAPDTGSGDTKRRDPVNVLRDQWAPLSLGGVISRCTKSAKTSLKLRYNSYGSKIGMGGCCVDSGMTLI